MGREKNFLRALITYNLLTNIIYDVFPEDALKRKVGISALTKRTRERESLLLLDNAYFVADRGYIPEFKEKDLPLMGEFFGKEFKTRGASEHLKGHFQLYEEPKRETVIGDLYFKNSVKGFFKELRNSVLHHRDNDDVESYIPVITEMFKFYNFYKGIGEKKAFLEEVLFEIEDIDDRIHRLVLREDEVESVIPLMPAIKSFSFFLKYFAYVDGLYLSPKEYNKEFEELLTIREKIGEGYEILKDKNLYPLKELDLAGIIAETEAKSLIHILKGINYFNSLNTEQKREVIEDKVIPRLFLIERRNDEKTKDVEKEFLTFIAKISEKPIELSMQIKRPVEIYGKNVQKIIRNYEEILTESTLTEKNVEKYLQNVTFEKTIRIKKILYDYFSKGEVKNPSAVYSFILKSLKDNYAENVLNTQGVREFELLTGGKLTNRKKKIFNELFKQKEEILKLIRQNIYYKRSDESLQRISDFVKKSVKKLSGKNEELFALKAVSYIFYRQEMPPLLFDAFFSSKYAEKNDNFEHMDNAYEFYFGFSYKEFYKAALKNEEVNINSSDVSLFLGNVSPDFFTYGKFENHAFNFEAVHKNDIPYLYYYYKGKDTEAGQAAVFLYETGTAAAKSYEEVLKDVNESFID